jgi:hypothetical protein
MGYRSDVKYVIAIPTQKEYAAFLGEVMLRMADKPDFADIPKAFDVTVETPDNSPNYQYIIRVHWEWVKWYNDYDWVKAQQDLFKLAEEYDGAWFFARMGENDDDYTTDYYDPKNYYTTDDFIDYRRSTTFI